MKSLSQQRKLAQRHMEDLLRYREDLLRYREDLRSYKGLLQH